MRAGLGGLESSISTDRVSSGPAVLVYEPNSIQRKLIDVVMRDLALRVFQVESVAEASQLIAVEPLDVVVVDIDSGVRAGDSEDRLGLVEQVVAAGTPVIIVTGAAVHGELDRVRRLGATAVLTKPYQPTVLRDAVEIATRTLAGPRRGTESRPTRPLRAAKKTRVASAFVSRVRSALERGRDEGGTGRDDSQDRLEDSHNSDDAEPPTVSHDPGGSADVVTFIPRRLRHVTRIWGCIGAASITVAAFHGWGSPHLVAWIAITTIAVVLSTWNTMPLGRVVYDPALPLKVALGIAAGPGAPIAVGIQGVISAIVSGIVTKAPWRTTTSNVGVVAFEGVILGTGLSLLHRIPAPHSIPWGSAVVGGLIAAIGVTIVLNMVTVSATLSYLTGRRTAATNELRLQFGYDLIAGTAIGFAMLLVEDPASIAWASLVGFGVFALVRLRALARFQARAFSNLAGVVEEFERKSAPLPDHSSNVTQIVSAMTGRFTRADQQRAIAAAAFHTLSLGGEPDRCSGGPVPEVLEQVRHLPRRWRIEANLAAAREKRHWAAAESLDVPGMVGLACAVDSLRLADGQLRTLRDIQLVWGFPARAIYDAKVMATGDETGPGWSPNLRPRPA